MRLRQKLANTTALFFLILTCAVLLSCGQKEPPPIEIGRNFYYWESTLESTLGDALKNAGEFKKLDDYSEHNLMNVFGKDRHFVWLRADFEIPPYYRNAALAMVIPHLRFADQVYCNNVMIRQDGSFPPNERSTLFMAHFFNFPQNILKQEGKNTIFIKVFVQGDAGISSHITIQPPQFSYPKYEKINFINARIYMLLFGIMFFTFILYLILWANLRSFKEYLVFAFLNLSTALLNTYFFGTELPVYTTDMISHLTFAKISLCIPGYVAVYLTTLFASYFYDAKHPFPVKIVQQAILLIQVIPTIFATSYSFLIKVSPFMMSLVGIQVTIGIYGLVKHILIKKYRKRSILLLIGLTPFLIGIAIDAIVRAYDNTWAYPYFFTFGWQSSIVIFIILLANRFGKMYKNNEKLSSHLREEVESRTMDLQEANDALSVLNERLEKDKHRSDMDLEMASLVQRKFLPKPNILFRGWEIAVCYAPRSKVSGDFYDYYSFNDTLNGITLFDVSGHGLSASLVTMLSKNIISRLFQTGFRRKEHVDKILTKINNMILYEKGDIDNYMTGILCSFDDSEDPSKCKVELGNAGHPYPLKYSLIDNEVFELKGNDGKEHYGAIGMRGIKVSFARSNFVMSTGDILLLYTDGLTEATNQKQEQFGLKPIKKIIKENHAKSADELLGLIIEQLELFTEYKEFDDDLTIIIAKRKNPSEFVNDAEHEDVEIYEEQFEELEEVPDEPEQKED